MPSMPDLTPLGVRQEASHLRFFLRSAEDILEQLPPDYEVVLGSRLAAILADESARSAEIDLENVPGITSRQLGALIALGRVLRPRFGLVPLHHASANVVHLLKLTKTDSLFKLD